MAYTSRHTILASAARTTTGASGSIDFSTADEVLVMLNVTAASGTTPTLDVSIVTVDDDGTEYTIATFTQKTAVAKEAKGVSVFGSKLKINYTIGGTTPSFTFAVTAIAKTTN